MKRINLKSKKTWKKIVSIVLGVGVAVGSLVGSTALFTKIQKQTHKTISPTFSVGEINTVTGKGEQSNSSIYTKDSFDAKGLKIVLDFDADISYRVFWYNQLGEFEYVSDVMNESKEFYTPYKCKARIQISPNSEENVSWYETLKYSNQMTIQVAKDQTYKTLEFKQHDLSSTIFTKHDGSVCFDSQGVVSFDNNTNKTYSITNNGSYSAFYIKSYKVDSSASGFHLRLKDGKVINYYSSAAGNVRFENDLPLPMKADEAIYFPEGATLYIWSSIPEADLTSNIVCFY